MSNLRRRRYNLRPVAATGIVHPAVVVPPSDLKVSPASGRINITGSTPTVIGASSGVPSNLVANPSSGQIRIAGSTPFIINNSSGQTTYQPLTGFNLVQDRPLPPTIGRYGGNDRYRIAKIVPVGGTGPFKFGLNNNAGGKYALDIYGYISPPYLTIGPNNDTINVTVYDANGATYTSDAVIVKGPDVPTIFVEMPWTTPNNQDDWRHTSWNIQSYGTNFTRNDSVSYTANDPTSNFDTAYQSIETFNAFRGQTHIPPLGNYPITLTATSAAGGTITERVAISVVPAVMGPIVFTPSIVSTAVPVGWVVGTAKATTPQNSPQWSLINDGGGKYLIDQDTGIVTVFSTSALTVTTDTIIIGCSERGANQSGSFQIPVAQGVNLSSTNMAMSVNQTLTNYATNFNDLAGARIVGNPTVSGFPDQSKIRWAIKQERFSTSQTLDIYNYARGHDRFIIDSITGRVTAQAQLSYTTGTPGDWIDLTATDGIYVCKERFYVPVAEVIGPVWHVGQGMSNTATRTAAASANGFPAGSGGFEHLGTVLVKFLDGNNMAAAAGSTVYIYYNPDPNYYAGDFKDNVTFPGTHFENGIYGPVNFIGVPGPQGQFPRLGGPINGYGGGNGSKGFFLVEDGDFRFKNLEISFVRAQVFGGNYLPQTNYSLSGIRWDQYTSGIKHIENCYIHDCNLCVETGHCDGELKIIDTVFANGGSLVTASGANQHLTYINRVWKITVDNSLFFNCMTGHIFKCRATYGTWTNSRFLDGTRGSSFTNLELTEGGTHNIDNCIFDKGAMPQNPYSIQFNPEAGWQWHEDVPPILTVTNSKFISHTIHDTAILVAAVGIMPGMSPTTRQYAQATMQNCQMYNYPNGTQGAVLFRDPNDPSSPYLPAGDTHDFTPTFINCPYIPASSGMPILNFTMPTTHQYGRPGWYDACTDLNNPQRFRSMSGVQIDPNVDQIRIPANSPATTVVFNPSAFGAWTWQLSSNPQPDPNINPFISGSVWSVGVNVNDPYGGSWGLNQSTYNVNPVNGQVTVGSSGAGPVGLHFFSIRVTSPASTGSKVAEYMFPIEKY